VKIHINLQGMQNEMKRMQMQSTRNKNNYFQCITK